MHIKCIFVFSSVVMLSRASRYSENARAKLLADVIPEALFELPLAAEAGEETWKPQTRSLLEPREYNWSQRPRPARPMKYSGGKLCEGACIAPRACDYHQGTSKGYCTNGNVCCVFQKSCGSVSREKVAFFRSPQYPKSLNESLDCSYRIYPSEDTCAIRIDFENFELKRPKRYTKVEKCTDDIMFIMNSAGGATEGICEMENHTAIVEVQPHSSHPLIIIFVTQSPKYRWSLKVSQINCKKLQPWENLNGCGRQLMYEPNEFETDDQLSALESPYDQTGSSENVQPPPPSPYIVNGKDAEVREFPWQVSLQVKKGSSHRCGGSIIDERHILTAAHCVFRNAFASKYKLKVIVGDYILDTRKDGKHEEFEIDKIIVHYNYKPAESHINDIAIIRLNGTMKFDEKVQPVCLLRDEFDVYTKNGIVSGWGRLDGTDSTAEATILQKINVKIITNAECKEMVRKEYELVLKRNLTYSDVARTSVMGSRRFGQALISNGGPLIIQNEEDGRYFQAGVVSYGLGKCRVDRQTPGSYTNIKKYLNFIRVATMEP